MDWIRGLDLLEWPAMAVTVAAAWFVASRQRRRRRIGFWLFLFSNVLWIAWGAPKAAWGLVTLQVALAAMNIRGARKAEAAEAARADSGRPRRRPTRAAATSRRQRPASAAARRA